MGQKGHIIVQKGLKMLKKRQKIEFWDLKRRFFSLAELGGTPPSLTENQCEKKKVFFLSGKGGHPPPFPLRAKSAKTFLKGSLIYQQHQSWVFPPLGEILSSSLSSILVVKAYV